MEAEQAKRLDDGEPVAISIAELVAWRQRSSGSRLLLPPIQRSLVWTNKQIIEYWDSLLRGYPPGLMLVHRTRAAGKDSAGIDQNGKTTIAGEDDYHLFDGQQRMAAILLGLGEGPLASSLRLWVDLDASPKPESGLLFQLRISSRGQPFGYKPESPNEKIKLGLRREQWNKWRQDNPSLKPFEHVTGSVLIDQKRAVEIKTLWTDTTINEGDDKRAEFVVALEKALGSRIILQLLSGPAIEKPEEYTRFFGRYGQGGTKLSNEELTYSIIKNLFPQVRARIEKIINNSGRLASEVDLVLAAMRIAKLPEKPAPNAKLWAIIGRPDPNFAAKLEREPELRAIKDRFEASIDEPAGLERMMLELRRVLEYCPKCNPSGLPRILLARLPRELLDVLLLIVSRRSALIPLADADRDALIAFALHWLLFIVNSNDGEKAANLTFTKVYEGTWEWRRESTSTLWSMFEAEGISYALPNLMQVRRLEEDVERQAGSARLRSWPERFYGIDGDVPGAFVRLLSSHYELTKRVLLWLQREEITDQFPDFDPTSGRDEDLPIDLDHIIPQATFDFNWSQRLDRLVKELHTDNFRYQRGMVGNSLGNYRWLAASANRSRGMDNNAHIDQDEATRDFIEHRDSWNILIPARENVTEQWSESHVAAFQYLIDRRTLLLYEKFICDSGIEELSRMALLTAQ